MWMPGPVARPDSAGESSARPSGVVTRTIGAVPIALSWMTWLGSPSSISTSSGPAARSPRRPKTSRSANRFHRHPSIGHTLMS